MRLVTALVILAACTPPAPVVVAPTVQLASSSVVPTTKESGLRLGPADVVTTPKCAASTPPHTATYPTTYPIVSPAERAARASALQQTGYWSLVDIDDYGFVRVVRARSLGDVPILRPNTPLPAGWRLDATEVAVWAETLPCQPDPFGLVDQRAPVFTQNASDSFAAVQTLGTETVGRISLGLGVRTDRIGFEEPYKGKNVWDLSIWGHFWPGATIPAATLTPERASARVIGGTYDVTWQLGPPPCVQGSPCPPTGPLLEVMTVAAPMVRVKQKIVAVRHAARGPVELRRVIRVDVQGSQGPCGANSKPRRGAPILPYFVDAVTGDDLSAWPCGFADDLCGQFFGG